MPISNNPAMESMSQFDGVRRPVSASDAVETVWMLLRSATESSDEQSITIQSVPFSVGRRPGSSLQLSHRTVSGHHADLEIDQGQLWVIDRQSTNGTYVNGRRICESTPLREEDLLQFADVAFRIKRSGHVNSCHTVQEDVCDQALALVQFDRLMENRLVTPFFQPIIDLTNGRYIGYEVLARSRLFGLESCAAMFNAAARLNMEVELSRMLRWEGVREGLALPEDSVLFVNTHPLEIRGEGLIDSMASARQLSQDVPIVLEIHEAAVTDPSEMRELRAQLRELNIGVAYDDFGAGQTRLSELVEAPPDFLKFDISLIRDIDLAAPERQRMLASLVSLVKDLGIRPLAEGVETPGEADACRSMGFTSAQGFHFGRPAPVHQYD